MDTLPKNKLLTAIVVRRGEGGEIVFHKYHNIPADPRKRARFERFAYNTGDQYGVLMHINYYYKENRQFSHRWYNNFDL